MVYNKGYKVKYLTTITFIAVLIVNFLANYIPINGNQTSEISDKYQTLFTPPGFIFAIWGVIYALLLIFTVYQFLELKNKTPKLDDNYIEQVSTYFMFSSIFNILWILSWHYELILISTIFILLIFICLFMILKEINKTYNSAKDKIFIEIPFSIYFGWIGIASLANLMTLYKYFNLDKVFSENITVIIAIFIGLIVISIMSIYFKNIAYLLTGLISYVSILINHINPNKYNGKYTYIIYSLVFSLIIFTIIFVYLLYKKFIKKRSTIFSN